jgi:hypothetical protein
MPEDLFISFGMQSIKVLLTFIYQHWPWHQSSLKSSKDSQMNSRTCYQLQKGE